MPLALADLATNSYGKRPAGQRSGPSVNEPNGFVGHSTTGTARRLLTRGWLRMTPTDGS